jgi:hypothetical protein
MSTAHDVLNGSARWSVEQDNNLVWLKSLPAKCVDMVLTSPPYESARLYAELDFKLKDQEWVDWCVERFVECLRICRGLVAWVVEGQTRNFRYSASPALLMADLHRRGVHLRKPPFFCRVGIPGSGGPDWLRNDYEWIICAGPGGKFPWSNNTAMGRKPKYAPGGEMSNRSASGKRKNFRHADDGSVKGTHDRDIVNNPQPEAFMGYDPPAKANPGNEIKTTYTLAEVRQLLISCNIADDAKSEIVRCIVGGGVMGNELCHENEAPFPESLANFFIQSFCPPDGIVCDPHSGSGTAVAVAIENGRRGIACDLRESQVALSKKRISLVTPNMFV